MARAEDSSSTLIELFSPAPPAEGELLSDAVARRILAMISERGWGQGHRLPPERELSEQMGVSRIVIREAFSALAAIGVVEAHVGRGRFVAKPVDDGGASLLVARWLEAHESEARDLNAVRGILEAAAARAVPQGCIPVLVERLQRIVVDADQALAEDDPVRLAELDAEFHKGCLYEVDNRPLRLLTVGIIDALRPSAVAVLSVRAAAKQSWVEHRRILRAFEEADGDLAALLIEDHLEKGYRRALRLAAADAATGERAHHRGE